MTSALDRDRLGTIRGLGGRDGGLDIDLAICIAIGELGVLDHEAMDKGERGLFGRRGDLSLSCAHDGHICTTIKNPERRLEIIRLDQLLNVDMVDVGREAAANRRRAVNSQRTSYSAAGEPEVERPQSQPAVL